MIGHATFCIVVVYNNVRRAAAADAGTSLTEASMDLGADGWQTFRFVTLPVHLDGARSPARCSRSRSRSTR